MLDRRMTLAGGVALAACGHARAEREARVEALIGALEAEVGGRIGVAALDTGSGARINYRAEERFAMCSTFKWLLAAAALQQLDRSEPLAFTQADLVSYSPVVSEQVAAGAMSVETLCRAAVVVSDNTAANLLIRRLGGPEAITAFIRQNAAADIRLDRIEPELNENAPGDPRDTTTPEAMVRAMQRLLVQDGRLRRANQDALVGWMIECTTGRQRLRSGLPQDWRAGDKTGTSVGANNATNDVLIAWPPKGAAVLIAAYLSHSEADADARNAAHARIARMIAAIWG